MSSKIQKLKKLKSKHFQWDEDNLKENDDIKSSMVFTKIDEPKTPYHTPKEYTEDRIHEIESLSSLEDIQDPQIEYSEESEVVHDPNFEAKRKNHYNEFQMKKLLSTPIEDEEDDEIEDIKIIVKV